MPAFWDARVPSYEQLVADLASESAWNVVVIDGFALPGVARVEAEPGRKIDVVSAPGTDGATIVDKGFEPAKPVISLVLWTPAHYDAYRIFLGRFSPRPGKSAQKPTAPHRILYAPLNDLGIDAVIITSISALKQGSMHGTAEASIKTVQWLKPRVAPITNVIVDIPNEAGARSDGLVPQATSGGGSAASAAAAALAPSGPPGNPGPFHQ